MANGKRSILDYRRALSPRGRCLVVGGAGTQFAQAVLLGPLLSLTSRKVMLAGLKMTPGDLELMKGLLEEGKVVPVIDKSYSLSEVPQALAYLGVGYAGGKVVITIN